MSSRALDREDVHYARALLQQEKDLLLPSRLQLMSYRLFNIIAIAMVSAICLLFVGLVAAEIFEVRQGHYMIGTAISVATAVSFPLVIAFLLNLPLVRKFWRLAGFRRDLGLTAALSAAFQRERDRNWVRNLVTGLAVFAGLAAVLASIVEFVYEDLYIIDKSLGGSDPLYLVFVILIGLSLIALHYMRRAKERLSVVTRLLDALADKTPEDDASTESFTMPSGAYKAIANLERENILLDRQRSIRAASKTNMSGFALQRSLEVQEALGRLSPETRRSAETKIFSLLDDASPPGSSVDADTGLRTLAIDDAGHSLVYEVDKKLKRVRIHSLTGAVDGTPEG